MAGKKLNIDNHHHQQQQPEQKPDKINTDSSLLFVAAAAAAAFWRQNFASSSEQVVFSDREISCKIAFKGRAIIQLNWVRYSERRRARGRRKTSDRSINWSILSELRVRPIQSAASAAAAEVILQSSSAREKERKLTSIHQ